MARGVLFVFHKCQRRRTRGFAHFNRITRRLLPCPVHSTLSDVDSSIPRETVFRMQDVTGVKCTYI